MTGSAGFGALLPEGMHCVEVLLERKPPPLLPAEAALLGRASPTRHRELAAGRGCARAALGRLRVDSDVAVLPGPGGEPCWPDGVIGSITHGAGICAAVTGRAAGPALSVGIDVAWHQALSTRVARRVLPDGAARVARPRDIYDDAVIFSAKESVFKAWYPLTRKALPFAQTRITVHAERDTFDVELVGVAARVLAPVRWRGRFSVSGVRVRTAVTVHEP